MSKTEIKTDQIYNEGVTRDDLNVSTLSRAVIRKILSGNSVTISSYTGIDSGTGDVTLDTVQDIRTTASPTFAALTATTRFQGNQSTHFSSTLGDLTILPGGYLEYYPLNFRFDQNVLLFCNRKPSSAGFTITKSGFTDNEIDSFFSAYAGGVNLYGKAENSYIQITASTPILGSFPVYPFAVLHANNNTCTCKIEVRWSGTGTWTTVQDTSFLNYTMPTPVAESGYINGVRWTFHNILNPTYLRWLGIYGPRDEAYRWTMLRSGDSMFGDFYLYGNQYTYGDATFGVNTWLTVSDSGGGNGRMIVSGIGSIDADTFWIRNKAATSYSIVANSIGVGIGHSNPSSIFHIESASAVVNMIASSGNAFVRIGNSTTSGTRKEFTTLLDTTNNRVELQAIQQGVGVMPIAINPSGGNVGIGTTSIGSTLTVVGTTSITGSLTVDNIKIDANNINNTVLIGSLAIWREKTASGPHLGLWLRDDTHGIEIGDISETGNNTIFTVMEPTGGGFYFESQDATQRVQLQMGYYTGGRILELDASKYIISVAKGTAYNKSFGTTAGTVSEGNHSHTTIPFTGDFLLYNSVATLGLYYNSTSNSIDIGDYGLTHNSTVFSVYDPGELFNFLGSAGAKIRFNLADLTASRVLELDASKYVISVAKATGYNLALGTTAGTVAEGNHTQTYAYGGTGLTSVAQGSLIYGSTISSWAALAKSTTTGHYLKNSGTSNNPAWSYVTVDDVWADSTSYTGLMPYIHASSNRLTYVIDLMFNALTNQLMIGSDVGGSLRVYGNATVNSLTVNGVAVTGKSYVLQGGALQQAYADDTTKYWGSNFGEVPFTDSATCKIYFPKAGTVKAIVVGIYHTAATWSNDTNTWDLYYKYNNGTATAIETGKTSQTINYFTTWTNYSLNLAVTAGSYIEIQEYQPLYNTAPGTLRRQVVIYVE